MEFVKEEFTPLCSTHSAEGLHRIDAQETRPDLLDSVFPPSPRTGYCSYAHGVIWDIIQSYSHPFLGLTQCLIGI